MKQFLIVLILSTLLILNINCLNLRGLSDTQENKTQLPEQQDLPQEDNNTPQQQPSENNNQEEEQQTGGDVQNNPETENDQGEEEQNNEEEQQQENNDEKQEENNNSSEEEEDNDDVDKDTLEKQHHFLVQLVSDLMMNALELNQKRNELLKEIAFFSIEGFVENSESLTAEDIHEQGNMLFKNQQVIEQLKELNKHLEDVYHQIQSIVM